MDLESGQIFAPSNAPQFVDDTAEGEGDGLARAIATPKADLATPSAASVDEHAADAAAHCCSPVTVVLPDITRSQSRARTHIRYERNTKLLGPFSQLSHVDVQSSPQTDEIIPRTLALGHDYRPRVRSASGGANPCPQADDHEYDQPREQ
eukprot:scpid81681/ scgid19234/ 